MSSEKDMGGIVLGCNAYSCGGDSRADLLSTLNVWLWLTSIGITRTSSTS